MLTVRRKLEGGVIVFSSVNTSLNDDILYISSIGEVNVTKV